MNTFVFIGILLLIALVSIVGIYNKLVSLRNYIKEAFSTMDVYLKKRWDLIPNLLEATKGYMAHEKTLLEDITNLRAANYSNLSGEKKIETNERLSLGISKLIAVAENYPDLKASQNFLTLQNELSKIEEDIASSRKYYNGTVREYNTAIQMFPVNVLAGMFGFLPEKMFEIDNSQRENVKVSF